MTKNLDLVGAMPFPADKLSDALASIDEAVSLLHVVSKAPPLPPARLTPADRLVAEIVATDRLECVGPKVSSTPA
jgi:hypothetical protein